MTDHHPFRISLPQHALVLRRRALKLTNNRHRAEDLVQETFLKAWAGRDRFEPGTNLGAWLFTILRNTYFTDLRKYRNEVEDPDERRALALNEEANQDDVIALKEVITAACRLPCEQRRPVILMGAYGYSQLEAADACECSVGTIKSRVSRGRAKLQQTLAYNG